MKPNSISDLPKHMQAYARNEVAKQNRMDTCTLADFIDHATGTKPMAKPGRLKLPAMPGHTHKSLLAACLFLLEMRGVFAWKANTGAAKLGERFVRFGKPGQPDIIGIMPGGRFLGVEIKVGRDPVRDDQTAFHNQITMQGGLMLVVRDTINWLRDALDAIDGDRSWTPR